MTEMEEYERRILRLAIPMEVFIAYGRKQAGLPPLTEEEMTLEKQRIMDNVWEDDE